MSFLSKIHDIHPKNPLFVGILANTLLSTVPGLSGAGPDPAGSLLVPVLDAELIWHGKITSSDATPNTSSGCPTPASITRAVLELIGCPYLFINSGLSHKLTIPALDMNTKPGKDPRYCSAVPDAYRLFRDSIKIGNMLSAYDTLIVGECVPGGTTTALCVLRSLGYDARVSSASVKNPVSLKEEIVSAVIQRTGELVGDPTRIIQEMGDPMMAVAIGIACGYKGTLFLAGGTQMLAVAALLKSSGFSIPDVITTVYVRDDPGASCEKTAHDISVNITYVDPGFGDLGHSGLVRYCIGEVKEGMGCGGAMMLAYLMGYDPDEITKAILSFVSGYCP